jgi:hypothetical protein
MCLITQYVAPTGRFVVEMFVLDLWCFVAMSFKINVSYNAKWRPNGAYMYPAGVHASLGSVARP